VTTTDTTAATWHKTACILCESNCGIEVRLGDDGRTFARIRGNKDHVASKGYTCEKALRLDHYQNHGNRLTSPLRRRPDGTHEEIDWDTAIAEVAERLARVRDQHGGDKIFYYGGGGQGNHLGGVYGRALTGAVGVRYRSNAIAQEKTGEAWVDGRMTGNHTRGDFEHAEVAVFVGKNPWMSHGFAEARRTLKEIANDPDRSIVVIDPRRTETAELADFHLAIRPGTDAYCLAALDALLVTEGHLDAAFLAERVTGADAACAALARVPVEDFADRCGVAVGELRAVAQRLGRAGSVAVFEDLGLEQAPNSTLSSYLEKLLWVLTGSFGKPGSMYPHSDFSALIGSEGRRGTTAAGRVRPNRTTPVTGARIIAGLVPGNSIVEEILTDSPDRFRALIVESANPAHSLADSTRWREAMAAVETSVVIDVAYTETARLAEYVLPAASQYEKAEMVFFNFEYPDNHVYLRAPVVDPLPGTLPEPEIHSRLVRALGALDGIDLDGLTAAAQDSRAAFAAAFMTAAAENPLVAQVGPVVLYETLGRTLPPDRRGAAALWFLAHMVAQQHPDAVRAAGHDGDGADLGEALFDAILDGEDGTVFTRHRWDQAWDLIRHADKKITIDIPEMLEWLDGLTERPVAYTTEEFPFILSAGERRSFTANTIFRDPGWRKRDVDGALRMNPDDAAAVGVVDGGRIRITTAAGSAEHTVSLDDSYRRGHVALPNGLGLSHPTDAGPWATTGVPPNALTSTDHRDELAGTPWHKHVPARLEPVGSP
jgi:anaerobic selenocysteine-containing dehydrogenase